MNNDTQQIISLENLIKSHIENEGKLQNELRAKREMHKDSFENNPLYREKDEKVKEATKSKNSLKKEISKKPDVARLDQKIKDLQFDLNESKKTLSGLLLDYKELTQVAQLELFDGSMIEIAITAKPVRVRTTRR
jgi:predicted nuclease with TOPRIM domain